MKVRRNKPKPLTVSLPVCTHEDCRQVGKIPGTYARGNFYCTGPTETPHRRVKMRMQRFEAVAK